MTLNKRFNRRVSYFVDAAGSIAIGIAKGDSEFDYGEWSFIRTDDVGVTVYGGNDESKILFYRQQIFRGEFQLRRVSSVAVVILRDTLTSRFVEEGHIVNVSEYRHRHHRDAAQSDVIHKVLTPYPANLLNSRQYLSCCFHISNKSVTHSSKIDCRTQSLLEDFFDFFL